MITIAKGIAKTVKANKLFSSWFQSITNFELGGNIRQFISKDAMLQKGVFEAFFATQNIGIYVRTHGYDVYILDPSKLPNKDKNATFLYEIVTDELGVDYYIKRHWNEIPKGVWNENDELKLKYFTIQAIIFTMKYINV